MLKLIAVLMLLVPVAAFSASVGKTVNFAAFQRLDTSSEFEGVVEGSLIFRLFIFSSHYTHLFSRRGS